MTYRFDLGVGAPCDLTVLTDTRALIQANSGGGKSHTIRRLLEQTHGKIQQIVVDPEGEFSTLREKGDYVLAARQHGDTIVDPRSAKLLAERILELGVSAILDIYELKAHERIRFVRFFLEALVDAPKKLWHPALVVVDEAHVFCPQVGEAESAGAVIDLATRGRKRGYCAVLATQRLSKLHKDAAAECNNKLIGRTGLDVDMKRAADELGLVGREEIHKLRTLEPGEFFAFGPAFGAGVKRIKVGPVKTSHPKAGSRIAFEPPPPTEKVKKLLPQLADLPAEAEERAKSIEEARKEISTLKRQLTLAQRGQPTAPPVVKEKTVEKRVEVLVVKDPQIARVEKMLVSHMPVADRIIAGLNGLAEALRRARQPAPMSRQMSQPTARPAATSRVPDRKNVQPREAAQGKYSGSALRILNALAWLETIGKATADKTMLALMADASPTSGGYFNNLGVLRTAGLITYPSAGTVALTDAGREDADPVDAPTTSEELHAMLYKKLSSSQQKVLAHLIAIYPEPITKDELAEAADQSPTSGGYFNNLGRLRSLGLIDYPVPGQVVALPVLFLET